MNTHSNIIHKITTGQDTRNANEMTYAQLAAILYGMIDTAPNVRVTVQIHLYECEFTGTPEQCWKWLSQEGDTISKLTLTVN